MRADWIDQAHDHRHALAGAQRIGNEPVLAADGNQTDLVLDTVFVDRRGPVGQVMEQHPAPFEGVVDGFGTG